MRKCFALGILVPLLFYGSLGTGDYFSSERAYSRGGVEVGPFLGSHPSRTQLSGAIGAQVVGLTALDFIAQKKGADKKLLWTLRGIAGGMILWRIQNNLQVPQVKR